jgi:uncharacterized small protein (DUF1192 family)
MMNDEQFEVTEALASAWTVGTTDISARVSAAIGGAIDIAAVDPVLTELRALRQEIAELRGTTTVLQSEIIRLRQDLHRRPATRIAPYSPSEGLVRLS